MKNVQFVGFYYIRERLKAVRSGRPVYRTVLRTNSDCFSPNNVNKMFPTMEANCVFCEVRAELLHITCVQSYFIRRGPGLIPDMSLEIIVL
jgi:hypothetical protein